MNERLKVLFLCTGNSCRSQMAEGWAKYLKGNIIEAYSAGIEKHGVNPHAIEVMQEVGVDISSHQSKYVKELIDIEFDYVVTVCNNANKNCPYFSGRSKKIHVGFDDPGGFPEEAGTKEEVLKEFRRVRDEIKDFISTLPESLKNK